jgi:UDP-N-acetylmuramoylalanine--D-glutamate ligase
MNYKNKKVLVYGAGISGLSAASLLLSLGAKVSVFDDGGVLDGIPVGAVAVSCLEKGAEDADAIVLSPSINPNLAPLLRARESKKPVIGELELAYSVCDCGITAVTGTNGKTTATLLISELLNRSGRTAYALGNIGIPFSDKVLSLTQLDMAIIEASSFQLETVSDFSPDIAVMLNLAPDHLDRHKSFAAYCAAKTNIFKNQINHDIAVLNADDETVLQCAKCAQSERFYFSKSKKVRGVYTENGNIFFEDTGKIFIMPVSEITLLGGHNLENCLAAATVGMVSGVNPEIVRMCLKTFLPPEYRGEFVAEKRGKRIYNDSKGTNTAATLAAARSMSGDTVLIIGGSDKGEDYCDFFNKLPKSVVHVFVTGSNAAKLIEAAVTSGFYNVSHRATLAECLIESTLVHAENVLFSPASASFDRYRDYRERGADFNRLVSELT